MILRAYGNDSSIDLFENHLVITRRRPGFFVDAPSLEQMVPLSSIKSVQFIRPGLFAHGKIVLSLVGNSSLKPGTVADENTVFFGKSKLGQFEDLLHAIREAIATPSIERLAMAAQRSARVGHIQPPPTENHLKRIASQPNGQGSKTRQRDDDTDGHAHYTYVHQSENRPRPLNPAIVGLWRDMPLLGKVLLIGFAIVLLPSMCTSGDSSPVEGPANEASNVPVYGPGANGAVYSTAANSDASTVRPKPDIANEATSPTLVEGGMIYLWGTDTNFFKDSFFSPATSIERDGSCDEETWVFSSDSAGKAIFAHNYNLQKAGELGRTTKGNVAASAVNGNLVFSNVEVHYWPSGSGTSHVRPHSVHLKREPDQTVTFEITGQAQRIASINAFKINGIEYEICSETDL